MAAWQLDADRGGVAGGVTAALSGGTLVPPYLEALRSLATARRGTVPRSVAGDDSGSMADPETQGERRWLATLASLRLGRASGGGSRGR